MSLDTPQVDKRFDKNHDRPNLVLSDPDPTRSLTAYNAVSSPKTLGIMLTIAIMGVPVVLAFTASIYRIFRGKVKLDRMSY